MADIPSRERPGSPGGWRGAAGLVLAFQRFACSQRTREINMLWTIVAILLILWLLGFSFGVGGSLVHLVLAAAAVVVVINLLSGRRRLA